MQKSPLAVFGTVSSGVGITPCIHSYIGVAVVHLEQTTIATLSLLGKNINIQPLTWMMVTLNSSASLCFKDFEFVPLLSYLTPPSNSFSDNVKKSDANRLL